MVKDVRQKRARVPLKKFAERSASDEIHVINQNELFAHSSDLSNDEQLGRAEKRVVKHNRVEFPESKHNARNRRRIPPAQQRNEMLHAERFHPRRRVRPMRNRRRSEEHTSELQSQF